MMGAGIPFGAEQRLLPEWIPLTFFAFSLICLPLGWLLLTIQHENIASFSGGFGPVLGTIHMFTLGVLMSTAFGASMQMLPVATGAVMNKPARVISLLVLFIIGTTVTLGGFSHYLPEVAVGGTAFLYVAALLYILLIIRLLLRADGLHLVRRHAFSAGLFLFLAASLGLFIIFDWAEVFEFGMPNPGLFHAGLAIYGFMGLLVMGFSRIMVPMLSVSDKLNDKLAFGTFIVSLTSLILWAIGFALPASILGLIAACCHVYEMTKVLQARLMSRLGPEWLVIRFAWGMFPLSLLLVALSTLSDNSFNLAQQAIFVAVTGWLVSFVIGILQRIIPFLLSMQIARRTGMPELPSKLCNEKLLSYIGPLHICAVLISVIGIAGELPILLLIGGLIGITSGVLFLAFFIDALKRKRKSLESLSK
jgi:hypothetical protein